MADRLARIFGTEEDKVNCPFYYKIGACRHGERCSRNHMKPNFSQTLVIPHMYIPPPPDAQGQPVDDTARFEDFFQDIMEEFTKFGHVEELAVLENLGDHMMGNVYVKFKEEDQCDVAIKSLHGRYFDGRVIMPEYSPVTDFREARCRQFDEDHCSRGGYCNFMHLKRVSRPLRKLMRRFNKLYEKEHGGGGGSSSRRRKKSRSRSRSRSRRRRRRSRSRSRSRHRRRRSRSRSRSRSKSKEKAAFRSGSAERRAQIAMWNKQRTGTGTDDQKTPS